LHRRPVRLAAGPGDGPEIRGPLVVADRGFNLHARTCAGALDEAGRLALLKYVLRPPVANDRLTFTSDGKVGIALKRELSDGTYAIDCLGNPRRVPEPSRDGLRRAELACARRVPTRWPCCSASPPPSPRPGSTP
jgi:hypothetical protein